MWLVGGVQPAAGGALGRQARHAQAQDQEDQGNVGGETQRQSRGSRVIFIIALSLSLEFPKARVR